MKAAVLYETGGPDIFKLEDAPIPKPKETQILLKVAGAGMCGHDQADRMGLTHVAKPVILGHEISGTVVEVGSQVRDFKVGDRVATKQFAVCGRCLYCRSGRDTLCVKRGMGGGNHGGYGEYTAVEDESAAIVPDNVDLVGASIIACAAGTCWRALKVIAKVQKGENVVVTGAGGGLGIHGIQLVKVLGGRAIAVTSSADKVEKLKEVGADEVVLGQGNYQDKIMEVTDGKGADVVLDNVGAPTFGPCFRALARYGRYVFAGQVSRDRLEVYPFFIFSKECIITGSATTRRYEFLECLDLAAQGKLKPMYQSYPLTQIARAFGDMDNRRIFGRGVLVP